MIEFNFRYIMTDHENQMVSFTDRVDFENIDFESGNVSIINMQTQKVTFDGTHWDDVCDHDF